jgi:hypothetical protein
VWIKNENYFFDFAFKKRLLIDQKSSKTSASEHRRRADIAPLPVPFDLLLPLNRAATACCGLVGCSVPIREKIIGRTFADQPPLSVANKQCLLLCDAIYANLKAFD